MPSTGNPARFSGSGRDRGPDRRLMRPGTPQNPVFPCSLTSEAPGVRPADRERNSSKRSSRRRGRRVKAVVPPPIAPALTRRRRRIRCGAGRGPRRAANRIAMACCRGPVPPRSAPARALPSGERPEGGHGAGIRRRRGVSRACDRDGSPQGPGLAGEARYAVRQPGPQGSRRLAPIAAGLYARSRFPELPQARTKNGLGNASIPDPLGGPSGVDVGGRQRKSRWSCA